MKGIIYLASVLLLYVSSVSTSAAVSASVEVSPRANVELNVATEVQPHELSSTHQQMMSDPSIHDVIVRHLESMGVQAKTDAERREQAKILFRLFKAINPIETAAWGTTEADQFEMFYTTVFKKMLERIQQKASDGTTITNADGTTTTTYLDGSTTTTNKDGTSTTIYKDGTTTTTYQDGTITTINKDGSTSTTNKDGMTTTVSKDVQTTTTTPTPTTPTTKTEPTEVAPGLSFFQEIYDPNLAQNVRQLQDNTKNIEPIVQSTKKSQESSTQSNNEFQSPTVLDDPDASPTDTRRLSTNGAKPVQVLFCDVSGNAIWKWVHKPAGEETPITTNTTTILAPPKLCEATQVAVKVSAYQSGCSRQNHPEGCDQVYYKGCGGLTVNRASNHVIVARTGGRSLGMLYWKQVGDTCQGRVVDAVKTYRGKKFNSPTSVEYTRRGDLYFTDSPFGLATSSADFEGDILDKSPLREIPFNGVYLLRANSTTVELVDCFMDRPNKIAFSPNQDRMYITNSRKGNSYVKEFILKEDGTVLSMKILYNFSEHPDLETANGIADGIRVDSDGLLYVAVHNGVFILSPNGALIGVLRANQPVNGLAIGGGRMFLSGAFGVVAHSTGVQPALPIPQAKTDCN